jgi:ribulose-phosphate 3-epimerase
VQIIPAILESDPKLVAEKIALVKADGQLNLVQIDIIDGALIERLTVTPYDLVGLDFGHLQLDFHLMTEDPLDYLYEIAAQAQKLPTASVYGQVERMSDQQAFLRATREHGYTAGLALDLPTPLDSIESTSWQELEAILLLSVPMGRQGQEFDQRVYQKIVDLKAIFREVGKETIKIVVDGGIKLAQTKRLAQLGINQVAMGSYFWQTRIGTTENITF